MPYIGQPKRDEFDEFLDKLPEIQTAGQLGYVVAKACDLFLQYKASQDTTGLLRYQYMGEVFGLLESIKFDFYHCVNEPYENDVRARSGHVWKSEHLLPGRHNPV